MKSLKIGVMAVAAVLVVVLVACLLWSVLDKSFYAVSTADGQFFVGRVSYVPFTGFLKLDNPFVLQNVQNEDQTTTQKLVDLSKESYWLPNTIYINFDQVIFKGKIGETSAIAIKLKEYYEDDSNPAPAPIPVPAPAN